MRGKMKDLLKRIGSTVKRNCGEILAVMAALAMLCGFVSMKEGFHMDELISYEFANAEYNPWIVPTQPEGRLAKFMHNEIDGETLGETLSNLTAEIKDVLQNRGGSKLLSYKADVYEEPVWITREQFRDYITVDRGDAFNYLSVYFNILTDVHPPLYYMVLHTVSSVFQGRAEAWMGCLINLAAIAIVMVLLVKIGRLMASALGMGEKAGSVGFCCALFYGFSAGAVATTLLTRMYGMVTLWCVAYFWLILKKWEDREYDRRNLRLILITALGFWTQYFFLFYCILLAAVAAVALLRSKRVKEFWCFVRSMLLSAVLGLAVFPFAVQDVISSDRGVEALENLTEGMSGFGMRLAAFLDIVQSRTFSGWFWVMLLVLAVFVSIYIRTTSGKQDMPEEKREKDSLAGKNRRTLLWMLLFPAAGYFLLAARMSPYLVDRYVMPVFPFVILAGVLALSRLLWAVKKSVPEKLGRGIVGTVCILTLLLQVFGLIRYDGSYLYRGYRMQEKRAEQYADYSCICVYGGVRYYENLKEFTQYEKTLLLTLEELENRMDRESIAGLDRIVVLVKSGIDCRQVTDILNREYGFVPEDSEWVEEEPYGDTVFLVRKEK